MRLSALRFRESRGCGARSEITRVSNMQAFSDIALPHLGLSESSKPYVKMESESGT